MLIEVRDKFLNFFRKKDHTILETAPLIPKNDKSILFINSGMAPLKSYFLNEQIPKSKRIASCQKCLRVGGKHNDLSQIGYTKRHHTFFEMLGNFSFGDYFKEEAIKFAWEFLVNELNLDKERLFLSVHPEDEEAYNYWSRYLPFNKIVKLESNIWTMGDIGPWGYCSEIFYDLNEGEGNLENGDRYLEIWNLVFTQFYNNGQENFNLDFPCIDTGIGLERLTSVLEGKSDNYEINFFKNCLTFLKVEKNTCHSKIFLDHLRSTSSLIMENILPEPSEKGYILRRLIRRMLKSFFSFKDLDFNEVVNNILNQWQYMYNFDINLILTVLNKEKELFEKTLNEGVKKFYSLEKTNDTLKASDIFLLHDTYGLTVDIVFDLLKENKKKGDFEGFEMLMNESRKKNDINIQFNYPVTKFLEEYECKGKIIGIEAEYLILDQTIFYAEGGGQVGDTGTIIGNNFEAKILDTKKNRKIYLHKYEMIKGDLKLGEEIYQKIDKKRRQNIAIHHSCSHLLQYALEQVYGSGIKQMGSYVNDSKFREDFLFPYENFDIEKIENLINFYIGQEIDTKIEYMNLDNAKKIGAKAFFQYDNLVRVVRVGDSIELCGGSHVKNTKDILICKIIKVSNIKNGIKRFEGIAGAACLKYLKIRENLFKEGCSILQCNEDSYVNVLKKLTQKKENPSLEFFNEIDGNRIGLIKGKEEDNLIELANKNSLNLACLYVEKNNKCNVKILSKMTKIDSRELVNFIGPLLESRGGGGNSEFAQTGGKKQENLKFLFNKITEYIRRTML